MGKGKRTRIPSQSQHYSPQDDYNVSNSFSRVKRYRSSNPIQTDPNYYDSAPSSNPNIIDNSSPVQILETLTSIDRNDYYNLDNKIATLTSQNNEAHEGLRKEFEKKVDVVLEKVTEIDKSQKSFWKWFIGISATLIIAYGTWLYNRLSLSNSNKERIDKIEYKIDETIVPFLNGQTTLIEKHSTEIKELSSSKKEK